MSIRTNFLTGARYANFRSVAVSPDAADGTAASLIETGCDAARALGAAEVVGKVHATNVAMRVLYRQCGFEPQHLTMRRRLA
jgi:hypothetical protein